MKVYVAERAYNYEGFTILGIFSTREAAQEVCDNDTFSTPNLCNRLRGDSYTIEEHEVDIPIND